MQGNSRELMLKAGLFVLDNGATYVKDDSGKLHLIRSLILDAFQQKWAALDEQDIPKLLALDTGEYTNADDDLYLVVLADRWIGGRL